MKKTVKKIGIGLGILFAAVAVFLVVLTVFHRVSRGAEEGQILPPGELVAVNGHTLHVYREGDGADAPLLVFLAGFGTAAPTYDFKPLYARLSDTYPIVVVERAGYGYSELADAPRDLDTVLAETREALALLGEEGPYILLPHSMSGLEALRWAQAYPDEVAAIIGVDMAIPSVYDGMGPPAAMLRVMGAFTWMGIQRIPPIYPVSDYGLTEAEYRQAKLLTYRNAFNGNMVAEGDIVVRNAAYVEAGGMPDVPILLLVSTGTEVRADWVSQQETFAERTDAQIAYFDCGHYLHQYEPERIADLCRDFLSDLHSAK